MTRFVLFDQKVQPKTEDELNELLKMRFFPQYYAFDSRDVICLQAMKAKHDSLVHYGCEIHLRGKVEPLLFSDINVFEMEKILGLHTS